jgi:hypothetical protein
MNDSDGQVKFTLTRQGSGGGVGEWVMSIAQGENMVTLITLVQTMAI